LLRGNFVKPQETYSLASCQGTVEVLCSILQKYYAGAKRRWAGGHWQARGQPTIFLVQWPFCGSPVTIRSRPAGKAEAGVELARVAAQILALGPQQELATAILNGAVRSADTGLIAAKIHDVFKIMYSNGWSMKETSDRCVHAVTMIKIFASRDV